MNETGACVICQLLSGELEVSMVHQDDLCSAFMDIQPVNPGHVLVVPHKHAPYLADLNNQEGAQMFRVAQRLAAALRESGVKCEGVNFFLADVRQPGRKFSTFTCMFFHGLQETVSGWSCLRHIHRSLHAES